MEYSSFFGGYGLDVVLLLAAFSLVAGFIDAVVGGGGLVQIPIMLINLPKEPLATIFGTNKIAALSGTSLAAYRYAQRIRFDLRLLALVSFWAFAASFAGAKIVSHLDSASLKPLILVILILIAIYTFFKKDLGAVQTKHLTTSRQMLYGSGIGLVVGFYDGFFGPGTGSFLVLGFVVILGFEFVTASAYAKIINCVTNFSALVVFLWQGNFILGLAIAMAIFNVLGNWLGSRMALQKGNGFVRVMFLIIVVLMIVRYSYDIFVA
ncbi:sulfite exporter TauE/SafE family protein [Flexibacter flexilis]|nr:TSUP family transporter [Flexibacter flexilis]